VDEKIESSATREETNEMQKDMMQNMALAMAYVPIQPWEQPYEAEVGFTRGTLFPSLYKPFTGEAVPRNG
jgi:hypothetical protein